MKRVKLVVAYDGTAYHGWQYQPNAVTIEEILNRNLSILLKEEITVIGASRTDAGVHSMGNVAVFDTNTPIPAEKISYALNQRLPDDIVVQSSCEVEKDFHPRYCKSQKTYEYRILNRVFRMPMYRNDTYFYHYPLDVEKMKKAAAYLVGEHDFASFCSANSQIESSVRTIYAIDIIIDPLKEQLPSSYQSMEPDTPEESIKYKGTNVEAIINESREDNQNMLLQGQKITIRVTGNGFLYNMVRIIAGTLIKIGSTSMQPEEIQTILEQKNRSFAGPTAPAVGLTMIGILYL